MKLHSTLIESLSLSETQRPVENLSIITEIPQQDISTLLKLEITVSMDIGVN